MTNLAVDLLSDESKETSSTVASREWHIGRSLLEGGWSRVASHSDFTRVNETTLGVAKTAAIGLIRGLEVVAAESGAGLAPIRRFIQLVSGGEPYSHVQDPISISGIVTSGINDPSAGMFYEFGPLMGVIQPLAGVVAGPFFSGAISGVHDRAHLAQSTLDLSPVETAISEGLEECREEAVTLDDEVIDGAREMIFEAYKSHPRAYHVYPLDGTLAVEAQDRDRNSVLVLFEGDGQIVCLSNIDDKPTRFRAKSINAKPDPLEIWLEALRNLGVDAD